MTTGKAKAIALGATCYCGLVSLLATCGKAPRMPAMDGAVIVFKVSGNLTVGEG